MSFIHDIPEFDDEYLGYAILAFMAYFMFLWVTGPSSPLPQFTLKSQVALLVAHLEVLLVAVIPLALSIAIQSLRPNTRAQTRASVKLSQLSLRLESYRKEHSQRYKRSNKILNKDENSNE